MSKDYGIIILAAGNSSRMGQSKQLLKFGEQTLLQRTIDTALDTELSPVVVVLGANAKEHAASIQKLPIKIITNEHWEEGMGSSIKTGFDFLSQSVSTLAGVVIMACDQPFVTAEHIKLLVATHKKKSKPLVASRYANTLGVPALFTKKYFHQIRALADSEGAKKIIMTHERELAAVDLPKGEIDIDTVEDFKKLTAK